MCSSVAEVSEVYSAEVPSPDKKVARESKKRKQYNIGFCEEFYNDIKNIDINTLGRLLKAITHISKNPLEMHGDTIKPLKGNLKGLWRYRIGNYRVIYQPDPNNQKVEIIAFDCRGNAYE